MFSVTHYTCGKPAFLLIEAPEPGEVVCREYARHLDRTRFRDDEGVICGSCGQPVHRDNVSAVYLKRIRVHDRLKT